MGARKVVIEGMVHVLSVLHPSETMCGVQVRGDPTTTETSPMCEGCRRVLFLVAQG